MLLLRKKPRQLLPLFLRKLQLFCRQFKGPSPLPAVQDFPIPSKPGHPLALVNILINMTAVKLIKSLKQGYDKLTRTYDIQLPEDRGRFFLCLQGLLLAGHGCVLCSSLCCMGSRRLYRVSW